MGIIDNLGMGIVVGMLIQSLDNGRYYARLQFQSARKMLVIIGGSIKLH